MINVSKALILYRERNNKSEDDLANYLGIQKLSRYSKESV